MSVDSALHAELRELVGITDFYALRDCREKEAAPHIIKIAQKHNVSEMLAWAKFLMLVGFYGRTVRIGEEPETDENGRLRKGKYGSRRLMAGVRA